MNFIFWNVKKNIQTFPIIKDLLSDYDVDICILAEFPENKQLDMLAKITGYKFHIPIKASKNRIEYIHKSDIIFDHLDDTSRRGSAKKIKTNITEINLIGCHLPSKFSNDTKMQMEEANEFSRFVMSVEQHSNDNTLVVGDFNMNPFEDGMVAVKGFNSVMDKRIALRNNGKKTYFNILYPYFYNPMWRFLGDYPEIIGGTYYYDKKYPTPYYWHILDQVLIRPNLIQYFDDNSLKIISKTNNYNLLSDNGIINSNISDHLPIYFKLNI